MDNIKNIVRDGLCTGCGTCIGICPLEAIELNINHDKGIYSAKINEDICNYCSKCFIVCSGHKIDFKLLNTEIFGEQPENMLIGNYLKCYTAYSNDPKIRYNSSSGGIITQLLIFALENGIIDGALVTRMKKENPLEPEPFIARTKEEIIIASKSKYCPVPVNIVIKEILKSKNEKFAVIGLPCHIHGLRKAEKLNKDLKEKIILHFGLFCHHGVNFNCTYNFLERFNINRNDVTEFSYRGYGWPGFIKLVSNGIIKKNYSSFWILPSMYFFTPKRCFMCNDALNDLADISFGDAWLPEFSNDNMGTSIIISRTKIGEKIVLNSYKRGKIFLRKCDEFKVIESQIPALYFKKQSIKTRFNIFKFQKKIIPQYDNLENENIIEYPIVMLMYLNNYLSSRYIMLKIIKYSPSIFLNLYQYIFYKIIRSRGIKIFH